MLFVTFVYYYLLLLIIVFVYCYCNCTVVQSINIQYNTILTMHCKGCPRGQGDGQGSEGTLREVGAMEGLLLHCRRGPFSQSFLKHNTCSRFNFGNDHF